LRRNGSKGPILDVYDDDDDDDDDNNNNNNNRLIVRFIHEIMKSGI